MPVYLYQILKKDGAVGEVFECEHPMSEKLTQHPETGEEVRRVYSIPNLASKYTPGRTQSLLSDENVADKGFTKYERDKMTGKYHKIVGDGPKVIDRPPSGS